MIEKPLKIYDCNPNNIPEEYHQAIGLVVTCASQTESIVGDFIASLLGLDNVDGMALTTHIGNPLKEQIARSLVELNAKTTVFVDKVDDLLDEIHHAQKMRNAIVHNSLCLHPETKEVYSMRQSARGSIKVELTLVSVDEFKEVALNLYTSGIALLEFMIVANLAPRFRDRPIHAPMKRNKKARENRREALKDNK